MVNTVQTLSYLDLSAQEQLLLLRKSLQVKFSHLARCAEYEDIKDALLMVQQAVRQAILQRLGRDENMLDIYQLTLPLRKGGLGLQCLTSQDGLECNVSLQQRRTQEALATAPESMQPFKGESGKLLAHVSICS